MTTQQLDHPATQNLLNYGSQLCKNFGLHTNSEKNVQFANVYGKQLRKISGYYVVRGETGGELRRVANAVFYILYVDGHPSEAQKVFEELGLSKELIHYVQALLSILECPPRRAQKRKLSARDPPRIIQVPQ